MARPATPALASSGPRLSPNKGSTSSAATNTMTNTPMLVTTLASVRTCCARNPAGSLRICNAMNFRARLRRIQTSRPETSITRRILGPSWRRKARVSSPQPRTTSCRFPSGISIQLRFSRLIIATREAPLRAPIIQLSQCREVSVRLILPLFFLLLTFASPVFSAANVAQNPPVRDPLAIPDDPENRAAMEKEMVKKANQERQAQIRRDTDRLYELSTQLKQYVDKSSENTLSLDVIKKAEEIEKLAHSVKEKMKGN